MTWRKVRVSIFVSIVCFGTVLIRHVYLPETFVREIAIVIPFVIGGAFFMGGVFAPIALYVGDRFFLSDQAKADLRNDFFYKYFLIEE